MHILYAYVGTFHSVYWYTLNHYNIFSKNVQLDIKRIFPTVRRQNQSFLILFIIRIYFTDDVEYRIYEEKGSRDE